jgi:hypothetical protein
LEIKYTPRDAAYVSAAGDELVCQTGTTEYIVHEFKDYVGAQTYCQLNWSGNASLSPVSSTVYLQIYNRLTALWETVNSNNTAGSNVNFTMSATISDLTNYKDVDTIISSRVYQLTL